MTFDAYAIYCDWCRDRGMPPPTKAWWEAACRLPRAEPKSDEQWDRDREVEGDAQ
jgi:hypothetical protein